MSIVSWRREFYPITPEELLNDSDRTAFDLRLWRGFTEEALRAHDIKTESVKHFATHSKYSALCGKYLEDICEGCPVKDATGIVGCHSESFGNPHPATYFEWTGNPMYMIRVLKGALEPK